MHRDTLDPQIKIQMSFKCQTQLMLRDPIHSAQINDF